MKVTLKPKLGGIMGESSRVRLLLPLLGLLIAALVYPAAAGATFRGLNGDIWFVAGSPQNAEGQLVASGSTGNRFRQVLPSRYRVFSVAASPDGRTVAICASDRGGPSDIYTATTAGKRLKKLTNARAGGKYYCEPTFSPDGRRIVFVTFSPSSNRGQAIRVMQSNGASKRDLIPPRSLDFFVEEPVFSPNGRRVAFTQTVRTDPGISEVYSASSTNGGQRRRLTDGLGSLNSYREPDYSPNGRSIVLTTRPNLLGGRTRIATIDAVNGGPAVTRIESPDGWQYSDPRYSPDGQQLIFGGFDSNALFTETSSFLFRSRSNGTNVSRLSLLFGATSPAWAARPRSR